MIWMAIDNHHLVSRVTPVADVVDLIALIRTKSFHLLARVSKVAMVMGVAWILTLLSTSKNVAKSDHPFQAAGTFSNRD